MDKECEAEFDKLKVDIAKLKREITKLKKEIDKKVDVDDLITAFDKV
jgi:peptidoglycan hydrolase CwlO-like protein